MLRLGSSSISALVLFACVCGTAHAGDGAPPADGDLPRALAGTPSADAASLPVSVELVSTPIRGEDVRTALEAELRVRVALVAQAASEGLTVALNGRRATVSFRSKQGHTTTRSLDLPDEKRQAVEVIALLAGNLARDEAAELLARLSPPEELEPEAPAGASVDTEPVLTQAAESSAAKAAAPPAASAEARKTPADVPEALLRGSNASANLSLYHPLTLLSHTERRALGVEVGAAYSRVGAVEGFGFTLGYLRVEHHLDGFATTFGWTRTGGQVRGVQWGGLVSEGHGVLRGFELANLATLRFADVNGVQIAGVLALSRDVRGVQGSAVVAVADDVTGVQLSTLAVARDVQGLELAMVGVARDVDGAELGVVNVARNVDLQLGVVNVAERVDGAAIGLVNIAGNGYVEPVAYALGGSRVSYNGGVKFVAGLAYSQLTAGITTVEGNERFRSEAGLGLHVEPAPLRGGEVVDRVAFELGGHAAHVYLTARERRTHAEDVLHYRAGVGLRFVRTFWLLGGYDVSHDVGRPASPEFVQDLGHGPWAGLALF